MSMPSARRCAGDRDGAAAEGAAVDVVEQDRRVADRPGRLQGIEGDAAAADLTPFMLTIWPVAVVMLLPRAGDVDRAAAGGVEADAGRRVDVEAAVGEAERAGGVVAGEIDGRLRSGVDGVRIAGEREAARSRGCC